MPYLAQKPQQILIALGWGIFQDGKFIKAFDTMSLQVMTLVAFLFFLWASRGMTSLKRIGTVAGTSMLVMSFLYVILMLAAPAMRGIAPATVDLSFHTFMPNFDAPLKVLLAGGNSKYIPNALTKTNKYGAPINGYKMTAVLVGTLIIIPALGIGNMNDLYNWLLDLNSIVMPLRYLWVFVAYIALRSVVSKFTSEYKFVKNSKLAVGIGMWCFFFTAFACIMGMFPKGIETYTSQWYFQFSLNVATPFILLGLGLILPLIAKWTNKETVN